MRNDQHSWETFDGLKVYAQTWEPAAGPKAVIALFHGVGDHSGRFPWLTEHLTAAGYAVSAFDQRGHGRTEGPRIYAPSYECLLRDIDRHLELTARRYPGVPLFLYGHSFGGAQVLSYVMKRQPRLAAVVASSPGLASGVPQPAAKVFAARILSRVVPKLMIPLGSPTSSLSHDPEWVSATDRDPLFFTTLSTRIAVEQLDMNAWILAQTEFPLPLLIMQGTEDRHVDSGINIDFARRLKGDITLKVWEGLGHELHNELSRSEVLQFAREWMDARLKGTAGRAADAPRS
jgi:alpha-beta hydrolase superfamily lysophospholipase